MAVQLAEPATRLDMLLRPPTPPWNCTPRPDGFRMNRKSGEYELTPKGEAQAAIVQRLLLRYVLGYESRSQLGARYGYASRHVQGLINGITYRWLTAPIRERLLANGIGNPRMNRSHDRQAEVKRALERLAARASDMLLWPDHYYADQISEVSTDLYLLSGAWREEQ